MLNAGVTGALVSTLTGYAALLPVMVAPGAYPVSNRGRRGLPERADHDSVLAHHRHHPCRGVNIICDRRDGRYRAGDALR